MGHSAQPVCASQQASLSHSLLLCTIKGKILCLPWQKMALRWNLVTVPGPSTVVFSRTEGGGLVHFNHHMNDISVNIEGEGPCILCVGSLQTFQLSRFDCETPSYETPSPGPAVLCPFVTANYSRTDPDSRPYPRPLGSTYSSEAKIQAWSSLSSTQA